MNPTDLILSCFEQISSIPRGTKNEAGIRVWLQDWAAARGLNTQADATGNLVIQVPASTGYENWPTLILQGHMDMVCQKTPDSDHDFLHDPIRILRDGDWIKADKTTLGADNGIAIALMMALVEDQNSVHPALELLLTVEEEVGLAGADGIDPSMISGKTLINLDSETEGIFTVGCAGGGSVYISLPVSREVQSSAEAAFELKISGLQGGHSGEDINKNRANANKLMGRVLDTLQRAMPIRLSALTGGSARNAIPRSAEALFVCPKDMSALCQERLHAIAQAIQAEYAPIEQELSITLTEKNGDSLDVISQSETVTGIRLLASLPNGVSAMSVEIPGFVETSNNIGVMELNEDNLLIVSNHRSSVFSRLEEICNQVESLAWLARAKTERTKLLPAWQPNPDSALLKLCVNTYQSVFEEKPQVQLSHGGLECGILSERCGGLDAISMGVTIENLHSPDERLYIPSLPKVWEFLVVLLKSFPA